MPRSIFSMNCKQIYKEKGPLSSIGKQYGLSVHARSKSASLKQEICERKKSDFTDCSIYIF